LKNITPRLYTGGMLKPTREIGLDKCSKIVSALVNNLLCKLSLYRICRLNFLFFFFRFFRLPGLVAALRRQTPCIAHTHTHMYPPPHLGWRPLFVAKRRGVHQRSHVLKVEGPWVLSGGWVGICILFACRGLSAVHRGESAIKGKLKRKRRI